MTLNQFKNLLAFLFVMTNEDTPRMMVRLSPDYIIEKFSRYGGPNVLRDDDCWQWGLHPTLRAHFDTYLDLWAPQLKEVFA